MANNYNGPWSSATGRTLMAVILVSCIINYAIDPYVECMLDEKCKDPVKLSWLTRVYARSLAVTCFASIMAAWLRSGRAMVTYGQCFDAHDAYAAYAAGGHHYDDQRWWPRGTAAVQRLVTAICLALILPPNVARLYSLFNSHRTRLVTLFFVFMYAQNLSMCLLEIRFVGSCHAVYTKFAGINREMKRIDREMDRIDREMDRIDCEIDERRLLGRPELQDNKNSFSTLESMQNDSPRKTWIVGSEFPGGQSFDDEGFYQNRKTGRPLAEDIEWLRIRHRLMRDALDRLNDLYAVSIGLSLCNLFLMTLFDVYYNLNTTEQSKKSVFIYFWVLQYIIRFFMIVKIAHATTKQAISSKEIVTNINRNLLDISTKYELQIFLTQISSATMEFTIHGLFSLNPVLLITVLSTGLTYVVILLDMKEIINIY